MADSGLSYDGYIGNILYDAVRNTESFISKYKNMAIKCSQENYEYQAFRSEKMIRENRYSLALSNPNLGGIRELSIREFPENGKVRALDIYFTTKDYNDVREFTEKQYQIAKEQYQRGVPERDWETSCRNLPFNIEEMYFKFNFKPYSGLNKLFSLRENHEYQVYIHVLYRR